MPLNNRSLRILVSIVSIPVIVSICIIGKIPFLIFSLIIGMVSFYEFSRMALKKKNYVNNILGLFFTLIIIINSYSEFVSLKILFLIISVFLFGAELFREKNSSINNIGSTLVGLFYIGLFTASLVRIREFYAGDDLLYSQSGFIIVSAMVAIWVCDSAAYFFGTAFGKHKLFPRVSPNKSWEGTLAGFVFAVIAMAAAKIIILDFFSWLDIIIIGVIIGSMGQIGDLIESMLKRDAGVKDSSAIIPGHGGVFDRFDSLFFTAPIIYIYMYLFF